MATLDPMPWWRWSLLAVLLLLVVGWSALLIPSIIDGIETNCAYAASEISDPCALGRGTYLVAYLGVWIVVVAPLSFALVRLWRGRR